MGQRRIILSAPFMSWLAAKKHNYIEAKIVFLKRIYYLEFS